MKWIALLALMVLQLGSIGDASADEVLCTPIDSVPYVISAPGKYCLDKNLINTGSASAAITINHNLVTLDCNDYVISRGSSGAQYGILANEKYLLKIRNCGLHLFPTGIALTRARVAEIRGNVVTTTGTGMLLTGHSLDIFDNVVTGIYASSSTYPVQGISVIAGYSYQNASGVRIVGNKIVNARSFGIGLKGMPLALIKDNFVHVMGNQDPRAGIMLYQLWDDPKILMYAEAVVRDNVIRGGGSGATGIFVQQESLGLCSGNTILGFAVAMQNCTVAP